MNTYYFDDAHHALIWASEIQRKRRFPKISHFYNEIVPEAREKKEDEALTRLWNGEYGQVPQDADDKMHLAIQVYGMLEHLTPDEREMVMMRYLGDYHSERKLKQATRDQLALREKGYRVRLNQRYSYRQLGVLLGMNHKTTKVRLDKALAKIHEQLDKKGLVLSLSNWGSEAEPYVTMSAVKS